MSMPRSQTLLSLLTEQAAADPDAAAVLSAGGRCSYGELLRRAHQVAAALHAEGVRPGDRVAALTDNRLEWIQTAFGCAALGAVLTPFHTWVKAWDLEYLLGHAQPSVLVMLDRLGNQDFLAALRGALPELWDGPPGSWHSERFSDLQAVVVIGDQVPAGADAYARWSVGSGARSQDDARGEDTALVLYTSGSTARPKAVPLTHGDLIANAYQIGLRQGLGPTDRVFVAAPLCWAYGSANAMLATFTHRAALVLQGQFEPARALDLMEGEQCTALYTLPAMSRALLDQPRARDRMATVRRGVTIGPPTEVRLVHEQLGADLVCNIYGSTETYGNCCVTPHQADPTRRQHSQGPALAGVELKIVTDGRAAAPGEIGEIHARGRITPGYLDEHGQPTPVVDSAGWFATGDLGSLDEQDWLSFAARDTEMIKTAGINVSPSEVEDFLLSHPDVTEVAVVGGDDAVRGQRVVAFVRLVEGSAVSAAGLRGWCAESIAGYKVPARIVLVTDFPTTQTGKLSRTELSSRANAALESR